MTAAIVVVGVGALVQGTTGFAFALIAAPLLLAATSPAESVSGLAVLSNVVLLPTLAIRPRIVWREAVGLVAWAVPGLALGAILVREAPELALRILLAAGVLLAVALRIVGGGGPARSSTPAAGLVSGVLTTSIGVNGPPLVVHLLRRGLSAPQIRGTLAATFVTLNAIGLAVLAVAGSLDLPPRFGWLLLASAAGAALGRALAGLLDGRAFEAVVLVLLVASAVSAIAA